MTPELKAKWIAALEGPYADKKGRCYMRRNDKYCCLGVLAEIEGDLTVNADGVYVTSQCGLNESYFESPENYGLTESEQSDLYTINDKISTTTFAPVIEYIKENL